MVGERPSEGSSHIQDARSAIRARAIASILLLAAGETAGKLLAPRREPGENAVPVVERGANLVLVAHRVGAECEIVRDGEIDERAAPLRNMRDAEPGSFGGTQAQSRPCRRA